MPRTRALENWSPTSIAQTPAVSQGQLPFRCGAQRSPLIGAGADINDLVRVLADGGIEQLAVAQLHHHGVLHVLAVELLVVVRDRVATVLEAWVAAIVLELEDSVDGRGHAGRPR